MTDCFCKGVDPEGNPWCRGVHADDFDVRRFVLQRGVDVSGVSGTGIVAEGVVFSDGTAVVHWIVGEHRSTVVWPDVAGVEAIHGHRGAARLVWLDQ